VYWFGIRCLPGFFDDAFYRFKRDRPLTHGLDWLLEPFELPFRAFSTDRGLFAERDRWIIVLALMAAIAVTIDWLKVWPFLKQLSADVDDLMAPEKSRRGNDEGTSEAQRGTRGSPE
jgi:hypothetical protein